MSRLVFAAFPIALALSLSACVTGGTGQRAELVMVLHSQVQRCYVLPQKARGEEPATVEVHLKADGTLAQPPKVLNQPANSLVAQAALRALEQCAPFNIPAEFAARYPQWKVLRITFKAS
ncbi:cell envelope integrity protein TolA [Microvirga sp. 2TAF3]|uniref:cell envelope integrity protein TolA n=1 Tax=Microvirga sp. 2TAF3 TaxID=3233014 RepID=UPI003F94620A